MTDLLDIDVDSTQAEVVTLLIPSNGSTLSKYKHVRSLQAICCCPAEAAIFGVRLRDLIENGESQVEDVTLFFRADQPGMMRLIQGQVTETAAAKLKSGSVTCEVSDGSFHHYGHIFRDYLSTPDSDSNPPSREIHLIGDMLERIPSQEREKATKSLANLRNVVSLTIQNRRTVLGSFPSLLNALTSSQSGADPTLKFLTLTSMMGNSLLEAGAAVAFTELLKVSSPSLKTLRLQCIRLNTDNLGPLREGLASCCNQLERLEFRRCKFDSNFLQILGPFLRSTQSLCGLQVEFTEFADQRTFLGLLEALKENKTIRVLNLARLHPNEDEEGEPLWNGVVTGETIRDLVIEHPHLQRLCLSRCIGISTPNLEKIAHGLRGSGMKRFGIPFCQIDDDGIRALVDIMSSPSESPSLEWLWLAGNYVGEQGAESISRYISQPSCLLQRLDLSCCHLSDSGLLAVKEGLVKNKSILALDLSLNGSITLSGWRSLAENLPKLTNLRSLKIRCPRLEIHLSDDAEERKQEIAGLNNAFLKGLDGNISLTALTIRFSREPLDPEIASKLAFYCQRNKMFAHIPSTQSQEGLGVQLWPFLLRKAYVQGPELHPLSLAFHLLRNHHADVFSQSVVEKRHHKRQKLDVGK